MSRASGGVVVGRRELPLLVELHPSDARALQFRAAEVAEQGQVDALELPALVDQIDLPGREVMRVDLRCHATPRSTVAPD
ncbi:hypothetical protein [Arthrobacter sp. MDT2-16]